MRMGLFGKKRKELEGEPEVPQPEQTPVLEAKSQSAAPKKVEVKMAPEVEEAIKEFAGKYQAFGADATAQIESMKLNLLFAIYAELRALNKKANEEGD